MRACPKQIKRELKGAHPKFILISDGISYRLNEGNLESRDCRKSLIWEKAL